MSLQYWSHKRNTAEPVDPDCSQYMASQWFYCLPPSLWTAISWIVPAFVLQISLWGVKLWGKEAELLHTQASFLSHTPPRFHNNFHEPFFFSVSWLRQHTQLSLRATPCLPFSLFKKKTTTTHTPLQMKYKKCLINTEVVVFVGCFTLECITTFLISQSARTQTYNVTICWVLSAHKQQCVKCSWEQLIQMKPSGSASGWLKSAPELKPTCKKKKATGATTHSSNMPRLVQGRVWGLWTALSRVLVPDPAWRGQLSGAFRLPGRVEKVHCPLSTAGLQHAAMALCRGTEAEGAPSSLLQFT